MEIGPEEGEWAVDFAPLAVMGDEEEGEEEDEEDGEGQEQNR